MQKPALTTDTLPTRASLLDRLRDLDDAQSWNVFLVRYQERVISIARSRGLRDYEAEEVAHEVFKRVARTIGGYQVRSRAGSFRAWLFQLTRWRVTDQLRERLKVSPGPLVQDLHPDDTDERSTPIIERVAAPEDHENAFEAESRQHLVGALLRRLEGVVTPKQLQIFQLLVLDEMPVARVAEVYSMSAAAIYVIKHRVATRLKEELANCDLPTG